MSAAEATGQHTLDSVVLYEGVNNFQTDIVVPNPKTPGETMKVKRDPLAGRDKLDIFLQLIARNLKHDLGLFAVLSTDATARRGGNPEAAPVRRPRARHQGPRQRRRHLRRGAVGLRGSQVERNAGSRRAFSARRDPICLSRGAARPPR